MANNSKRQRKPLPSMDMSTPPVYYAPLYSNGFEDETFYPLCAQGKVQIRVVQHQNEHNALLHYWIGLEVLRDGIWLVVHAACSSHGRKHRHDYDSEGLKMPGKGDEAIMDESDCRKAMHDELSALCANFEALVADWEGRTHDQYH